MTRAHARIVSHTLPVCYSLLAGKEAGELWLVRRNLFEESCFLSCRSVAGYFV
jgi:hypothetical protein